MSETYGLLKASGYSDKAIEYYETQLNVGTMVAPDAHALFTGSCGDTMEIFLEISDVITDAKFQAIGCAASFASGSTLCELIKGKRPLDCELLDETDILNHLGSMPTQKVHCAHVALVTLHRAIEQYLTKK